MTSIAVGWLQRGNGVLLGKRSEAMQLYPGPWDALGGHVEAGESPLAAVRRELAEEIGITADTASLIGTFEKPSPLGPGDLTFHVFAITEWGGSPLLANEHSELAWFEPEQAAEMELAHAEYRALLAVLRHRASGRPPNKGLQLPRSSLQAVHRRGVWHHASQQQSTTRAGLSPLPRGAESHGGF